MADNMALNYKSIFLDLPFWFQVYIMMYQFESMNPAEQYKYQLFLYYFVLVIVDHNHARKNFEAIL